MGNELKLVVDGIKHMPRLLLPRFLDHLLRIFVLSTVPNLIIRVKSCIHFFRPGTFGIARTAVARLIVYLKRLSDFNPALRNSKCSLQFEVFSSSRGNGCIIDVTGNHRK